MTQRDWLTYYARFEVIGNWRALRCLELKMVAEWETAPEGDDWHELESGHDYYRLLHYRGTGIPVEGNCIDGLLPRMKGNWERRQTKNG